MVLGLIPASKGRNPVKHKQGSMAHNLSLSSSHCPDMIEILLKRAFENCKLLIEKNAEEDIVIIPYQWSNCTDT